MMKPVAEAFCSHWDLDVPLALVEAKADQQPPYCVFSPVSSETEYCLCESTAAMEVMLIQVSAFATSSQQCFAIMDSVHARYDDSDFNIQGQRLIKCEHEQDRILRVDKLWHGIMEYNVMTQRGG